MKKKIIIIGILVIIIAIVLGGYLFNQSNQETEDDKIVLVTEAGFAPYEYYENGEIVGIDIDIANEIAKELGKELEIKDVNFDNVLNEVKFGNADFAAAGLSITEERLQEVDFSKEYTVTKQVIVALADSDINSPDDLPGKSVSVQVGGLPDIYLPEEYPGAEIINTNSISASVEDVVSGKADCMILDALPAEEIVKENPNLKVIEEPVIESSFGIAVKKGNTELLEKINQVIDKLISEGKIDEFTMNHTK